MKHDCFYEGLNPEYQQMVAHKIDDEHPASYSDLLLATQKLERWTKARDPLSPKTTATCGSNMTHSQMPGNLFPLHKLKGTCTFTTWAATVGNDKAEKDSGVKLEGEGGQSLAGEDVETSSGVGETDQSTEYIIRFAKAVELYQKEKQKLFCMQ